MRAFAAVVVATFVVAGIAVSSASAYDRKPIHMEGLAPDSWGNSVTGSEQALHRRYAGIERVWCFGVIMDGFESDSSWVHGLTRYWDKLACGGVVRSGKEFVLVYDGKARYSWTIYRLRGVSIEDLDA
jgi:hypothetical protein